MLSEMKKILLTIEPDCSMTIRYLLEFYFEQIWNLLSQSNKENI